MTFREIQRRRRQGRTRRQRKESFARELRAFELEFGRALTRAVTIVGFHRGAPVVRSACAALRRYTEERLADERERWLGLLNAEANRVARDIGAPPVVVSFGQREPLGFITGTLRFASPPGAP